MADADPTHAPAEGHGDGHGHAPETLGPIDWETWAYAIGGAVLGALVVLALFMAAGG